MFAWDLVAQTSNSSGSGVVENFVFDTGDLASLPESPPGGDINGNGFVDRVDAALLIRKLGSITLTPADLDGDLIVTLVDLAMLQANLQSLPSANAATVPEPSALVLLSAGLLGLGLFRRRRRI